MGFAKSGWFCQGWLLIEKVQGWWQPAGTTRGIVAEEQEEKRNTREFFSPRFCRWNTKLGFWNFQSCHFFKVCSGACCLKTIWGEARKHLAPRFPAKLSSGKQGFQRDKDEKNWIELAFLQAIEKALIYWVICCCRFYSALVFLHVGLSFHNALRQPCETPETHKSGTLLKRWHVGNGAIEQYENICLIEKPKVGDLFIIMLMSLFGHIFFFYCSRWRCPRGSSRGSRWGWIAHFKWAAILVRFAATPQRTKQKF